MRLSPRRDHERFPPRKLHGHTAGELHHEHHVRAALVYRPWQLADYTHKPLGWVTARRFESRKFEYEKKVGQNWSQTEAAERFKIPLSTLNQKIKRLQIEVKRRRDG